MPNYVKNELKIHNKSMTEIKELFCSTDDNGELLFDFEKIIPRPKSLNVISGYLEKPAQDLFNKYAEDKFLAMNELKAKAFMETHKKCNIYKREFTYNFLSVDLFPEYLQEEIVKELASEDEMFSARLQLLLIWHMGKIYADNIQKYGCTTWYDWCVNNWGTKWNACNTYINECEDCIEFETAWSAPIPIYQKMAEIHPDLDFSVRWADEDIGANAGFVEHTGETDGDFQYSYYDFQSKDAYETAFELWGIDAEEEGYVFDKENNTYVYCDPYDEETDELPDISEVSRLVIQPVE